MIKYPTPTEKQIKFAEDIAHALDIEFPWNSKQYNKKEYSKFINAHLKDYQDTIYADPLYIEDAYERSMNDAWTEEY